MEDRLVKKYYINIKEVIGMDALEFGSDEELIVGLLRMLKTAQEASSDTSEFLDQIESLQEENNYLETRLDRLEDIVEDLKEQLKLS